VTLQTVQAIILAAGKSSRFNTQNTKLSFTLCGQEMIVYPIKLLKKLNISTTVVLGYQKEIIKKIVHKHLLEEHISYSQQDEQKGTGDAVLSTQKIWHADNILILNADMPLVSEDIINQLLTKHRQSQATITFVTAHNPDISTGSYGRVVQKDTTIEIVEASDFNEDPSLYCCVNAGIYIVKRAFLEQELPFLEPNIKSGELYITDLIKKASNKKMLVETTKAPFDRVRGINTLKELWTAEHIKRSEIISYWMDRGIRFSSAQSVHIDETVTLGDSTTISSGVQLKGVTSIGSNCLIDDFCVIENSAISDKAHIKSHSVITNSTIQSLCQIGPFAHIHSQSITHAGSTIGNFVEISKSTIGPQSKVKHLSYIGQSIMGSEVNVGAGVITCNYNGVSKNTTTIEDKAFIGSNSCLIAPITIGKESFIAAGSVITQDVPLEAFAITRSTQITKEHYAPKLKERYHKAKEGL
jgi:bifunctional UDP-N-acetylglucosamine pyrophosphorylase / glucosamine-1-phosphate N-acetyltransferase